jgi:hypothetical protein
MSIMPLLMAAPMKTPIAATRMIFLKDAAREPMAEFRKLTASLLTPTDKSKMASRKRKMMMPKNNASMIFLFLRKGLLILFQFCCTVIKSVLNLLLRSLNAIYTEAKDSSAEFKRYIY